MILRGLRRRCGGERSRRVLTLAGLAALLCSSSAAASAGPGAQPGLQPKWWLASGVRVVTYEFLERKYRQHDLSPAEIIASLDRLGGCDLVLLKGFHYWQGRFDDSSWGYPRFRSAAQALIPKLHARSTKVGVFGFMDRDRSYKGGADQDRIMEAWREYVRLGADILFVDDESGASGADMPEACLDHCDELRRSFSLPVGLFLYGSAAQAESVRRAAQHVDVVAEMGYELFLQGHGDYRLGDLTRRWSAAAKGAPGRPVAYWTGALVFGGQAGDRADRGPGTTYWRERFGDRTLAAYLSDYCKEALSSGADGVFVHSICRFLGLPPQAQAESASTVRKLLQGLRLPPAEPSGRR